MGAKRRHRELGPLHDLLLEACPPRNGFKSIPLLAEELELSREALFKWIRNGKLPPRHVPRIIEIADGRISKESLEPFVYV